MKPGSVIIDVAIDQGGCFETSRPDHAQRSHVHRRRVVHYCVTNMPGAVGRTSTFALCNVTLPYVMQLAQRGIDDACKELPTLATAVNIRAGKVMYRAVAETFGLPFSV
jgi:alanine dehydrogenase